MNLPDHDHHRARVASDAPIASRGQRTPSLPGAAGGTVTRTVGGRGTTLTVAESSVDASSLLPPTGRRLLCRSRWTTATHPSSSSQRVAGPTPSPTCLRTRLRARRSASGTRRRLRLGNDSESVRIRVRCRAPPIQRPSRAAVARLHRFILCLYTGNDD